MERLNSQFLEDKPKFKILKRQVQKFYIQNQDHLDHKSYVALLYHALVKMLVQLASTKDKGLQLQNLDKIFEWFDLKRRRLMGLPGAGIGLNFDDNEEDLDKQDQQKALIKNASQGIIEEFQVDGPVKDKHKEETLKVSRSAATLLPQNSQQLHEFDKFILTTKKARNAFDFKARSPHQDFVPAKDRIMDYKRRQLVRQEFSNAPQSQQSQKRFSTIIGEQKPAQSINLMSRPETAATSNMNAVQSIRPGTSQSGAFLFGFKNFSVASFVSPHQTQKSFFQSPGIPDSKKDGMSQSQQNFFPNASGLNIGRPFTQASYAFKNVRSKENQPLKRSLNSIEQTEEFTPAQGKMNFKIDSKANFYQVQASSDEVDLKLARFWLANTNKELADKRSNEEAYFTLHEWSTAKERIEEEIISKYERAMLASNPARLAVLKGSSKKVQFEKIYKNQDDFFNSDEESLNTSKNSYDDQKEPDQLKKHPTKKLSSLIIDEEQTHEDLDNEQDEKRSSDNNSNYMNNNQVVQEQKTMDKKKTIMDKINTVKIVDLTKPVQEEDLDSDGQIIGEKIQGLNPPLEESSSEEEEDEKGKKSKKPVLFNVASTVGFDEKKQKIEKLRRLHGEIIGSQVTIQPDLVNNVFTSQACPDSFTMSIYNRPITSPMQQKYITGLHPSKSQMSIYTTKNRKMQSDYTSPIDLFTNFQKSDNLRPNTVGYFFNPQKQLFGRPRVLIEDRGSHKASTNFEQQIEVLKISQHLAKETVCGSSDAQNYVVPNVNFQTIQKAIMLPEDDIIDYRRGHRNPASINLLENPFAKATKGKKGKKGKKK